MPRDIPISTSTTNKTYSPQFSGFERRTYRCPHPKRRGSRAGPPPSFAPILRRPTRDSRRPRFFGARRLRGAQPRKHFSISHRATQLGLRSSRARRLHSPLCRIEPAPQGLGYKDLEKHIWVIPEFVALSGAYFPQEQTITLIAEHGEADLIFPDSATIPSQVTPARADRATRPGYPVALVETQLVDTQIPTFVFAPATETASTTYAGSPELTGNWRQLAQEDQLWTADIRDQNFKKAERNNRRLTDTSPDSRCMPRCLQSF